ncbi:MAG: DNA/RNA non-specific endonuclease [Gemmatimonadaceae bacterium]|nr:DNA/RNA non-specific endonuclease [Gemmatimonadaceae bacterium]
MGRIDLVAAVESAMRFQAAQDRQAQGTSAEVEADMLNKRREFLLPSDRVFFESLIDGSDILPIRYLEIGQRAARAVGRLEIPVAGQGTGFATGFLVAPYLLLTNQHVLRTPDWAAAATFTLDAADDVTGMPLPPRVFRLIPGELFVADEALDFAITTVSATATDGTPLLDYGYLRLFEQTGKIVRDEYATIVQHPNGRQKHVAARNNKVTVYPYDDQMAAAGTPANNFLYYETDTLRGSSGSPVFNDQWFVVALHRRGVPAVTQQDGQWVVLRQDNSPATRQDDDASLRYVSNEGTRISQILARLRELANTKDGMYAADAARALAIIGGAAGDVSEGPLATPVAIPTVLRPATVGRSVVARPGSAHLGAPVIRRSGWTANRPALGVEIARRALDLFPNDLGYDPDFLHGVTIPMPSPKPVLRKALAPRVDAPTEYLLPFRHFTTAMHAKRRVPIFAAVNIDGKGRSRSSLPQRPSWSLDPRIAEEHQPDDSIFSQMLQRGHQAAREYVVFGTPQERRQADLHSFTLTNVCPQIAAFNGTREWYTVEREVVGAAKDEHTRLSEFVGPILAADDPTYDSLRSPNSDAVMGTRIKIPQRFWKIIFWVEDGTLQHRAFILDQRDELEAAGPLELDIETPSGVEESTVEEIGDLTDLVFEGF